MPFLQLYEDESRSPDATLLAKGIGERFALQLLQDVGNTGIICSVDATSAKMWVRNKRMKKRKRVGL